MLHSCWGAGPDDGPCLSHCQKNMMSSSTPSTISMKWPGLVLLLLISLLAWQYFFNRSLWLDEAMLSLNIVQRDYTGLIHPLDYAQVAPILFLWIEKFITSVFGNSEMALRIFPFICSILSLFLVYSVANLLTGNRQIALLTLCLVGLTPKFIYFASEVKQYATDVTILLSLYYFTLSGSNFIRRNRWLLLSVTGLVSIFISNASVIPMAVVGILLLVRAFRSPKIRLPLGITFAVWAVAFGINYVTFIWHHPSEMIMKTYWKDSFMPVAKPTAMVKWWMNRAFHLFDELLPGPGLSKFYILTFILYVASLGHLLIRRQYRLIYLLTAPIFLHILLSALHLYPFDIRLVLYHLPLYCIVLAYGIYQSAMLIGKKRAVAVAICIVGVAIFAGKILSNFPMKVEEIRPLISKVNTEIQPGDAAYIYYYTKPVYLYYAETGRVHFRNAHVYGGTIHPDNTPLAGDLRDVRGHVWLFFSHVHPTDAKRQEERRMISDLQQRGEVLKEFEEKGAAVYQMDLR